ncbi:MAG: hypothetical protein ACQESG_08430 [Nanobdellota archaeon]
MQRHISYLDNLQFVRATDDTNKPHYSLEDGGIEAPVVSGFQLEGLAYSYAAIEPPFRMKSKFRGFVPVDSTVDFCVADSRVTCSLDDVEVMRTAFLEPEYRSLEGTDRILSVPFFGDEFEKRNAAYNASCDSVDVSPLFPVSFTSAALLNMGMEAPAGQMYVYSSHELCVYSDISEGGTLDLYLLDMKNSRRGANADMLLKYDNKDFGYVRLNLLLTG